MGKDHRPNGPKPTQNKPGSTSASHKPVVVQTKSSGNLKPLTKEESKAAKRKAIPRWKRWLKRIAIVCGIGLLVGLVTGVAVFAWFAKDLPSPDELENRVVAESTKIYDRTGEHLLYETGRDVRRTYTKLEDMSPYVTQATVALEDKNFYKHHGFDTGGIIRSIYINLFSDKVVGGSTITQQFVGLAIVGKEKVYTRKIRELILAIELERKYSKDEILEFYLNEASYGGINLGVAAGARSYFEKDAKDLTLAESAFLAAIPQKPSRITSGMETLLERKDFALDQMAKEGYITEEQAEAAKLEPIEIKQTVARKDAPHFVDYVIGQLEDDYGSNFINQGLNVITTLDYDKQEIAEQAITDGMAKVEEYGGSNAALVSLDAHNGQLLAMVGSKDYYAEDYDGQVNVATSLQQPGSSFKPIVYATTFANGYNPNTILFDVETDFPIAGQAAYHPRNFSLGESGPITMRRALGQSLNIPAVKALYLVGKDKVLDTADSLGYTTLTNRDQYGLSLALGAGEVKLLEHTSAFATFAREGERHPVSSVMKVSDRQGNVLYEWADTSSQVIDKNAAKLLNSVLSDQSARSGFNALNISGKTIAAKTGTSQDFRDAWTEMYTPSFATGIWVGNNDNTEMDYLGDGVIIAAPIANAYMSRILEGLPNESFNAPDAVKANKGVLNGEIGEKVEKYVDKGTQHIIPDECVDSYPAEYKEKKEFKEVHTILHYLKKEDPLGSAPENPENDPMYSSWDKAIQLWAEGQSEYISDKTEYEDCNLRSADQTPTVTILTPASGERVTSKTFSISARINAGTNRSIKKVEYIIDSTTVDVKTSGDFTSSYTPSTLTSGNHTLTVRVTNDRDNVADASVSFSYTASNSNTNSNSNSNSNSNKNNSNTNKNKNTNSSN